MNNIYRDETHADLVWIEFDGPTWDDFYNLVSEFKKWTEEAAEPFCLVFYPTIDMPKGSPLPPIKHLINFIATQPKIRHMITVVPKKMVIAKVFADLSMKLFPNYTVASTLVTDVNDVYEAYRKATPIT